MTKRHIKCDVCSGKLTDLTYVDTNNYELCAFCKDEDDFLKDWRNYRIKKRKHELKLDIRVNLIQKNNVYDDIVSKVLEYI